MLDLSKLQNGSDIRGIALGDSANLRETEAKALSYGFYEFLKKRITKDTLTVAVGTDSRVTGKELKDYVMEEFTSLGVKVLDCGLASTPAMFMATVFEDVKADGAIMITASHLPMDRNGFKYFTEKGGLEKADIREIIEVANGYEVKEKTEINAEKLDLISIYSDYLKKKICDETGKEMPLKGLHIVVDAGNGAGGFYATKVLEPLGCDISGSQFLEPDGTFPNHIPNPEDKTAMKSVSDASKKANADLGLIFDTDVDRSSCVDEMGNEISRNKIVALAASLIAKDNPGSVIVTDSITSNELTVFLEESLGLKHLRYMRGYRNVINRSIDLNNEALNSPLAIETSGHAAYKENFFLDDGAYLATKVVIALANGTGISTLLKDLKEPAEEKEVRIKVATDDFKPYAEAVLDALVPFCEKEGFEIVKPNYEGVRVNINRDNLKGWFLLRKSLHDPILPLNIETTVGSVEDIMDILKGFLSGYDKLVY
ncbi:MAG: phosphomannomutase/phosphoglucomutase [Clostridia bacterium]|nr:phosphomannomutase/phosphoglucomutase [Clostridia bacterium]